MESSKLLRPELFLHFGVIIFNLLLADLVLYLFTCIGEIGFKVLWTNATTYLIEHKKFISFNNIVNW